MNETFIRLTESDNNFGFEDANEAVVYASIKSWCSQGKRETDLSYRQIQSYIPYVSIGTIFSKVKILIDKNLVKIVGEKTRVGGKCPIYKVFSTRTESVQHTDTLSVQPEGLSVQPEGLSVQLPRLNSHKEQTTKKGNVAVFKISDVQIAIKELLRIKSKTAEVINNQLFINGKIINNPPAYLEKIRNSEKQPFKVNELPCGEYQNPDGTWTIVHGEGSGRTEERISNEEYLEKQNTKNKS